MGVNAKTSRFASIVSHAGRPEVHLTFRPAGEDPVLQKALKADRVMSVLRFNTGNRSDYGVIGYDSGATQFLIFPHALRKFEGTRIVGINYDLLAEEQRDEKAMPARRSRPATKPVEAAAQSQELAVPSKVRPLRKYKAQGSKAKHPRIRKREARAENAGAVRTDLQKQLERVLHALAGGKEITAVRMLRQIVKSLPLPSPPKS